MPPDDRPLARHECLRVDPAAWLSAIGHAERDATVAGWAKNRRPVMVRRRAPCDPPDRIAAAIALPPSHRERRFSLLLVPSSVSERYPPTTLEEASAEAPAAWRPTLAALVALGEDVGVVPRVFGSLFWQHATGLTYLTASSDVDLLWNITSDADVRSLLDGLARLAAEAPMRLDGELVVGGRAVQWRELARALADDAPSVLVKTADVVLDVPVAQMLTSADA